jgi:thiamine biosynthesis lipoprotein
MLWLFYHLWLSKVLFFSFPLEEKLNFYSIDGYAQGTTFHITYSNKYDVVTKPHLDSIFNKIDSSLSLYKSYSLINQFNNSTSGLVVDNHLFNVVTKSINTYMQTNGAFDITVKPLVQAWGFGVVPINTIPDSINVAELKKCTGSDQLKFLNNQLKKAKACIQIDCNGIAQGYSVDVLAAFLEDHNIINYLIEVGGEIRVKGKNQKGEFWSVGIESAGDDINVLPLQRVIHLQAGAITTSGNYRNFYTNGSKKYHHIINPITGYPVDNGLISVTVIAKDAITADAFDNSFMVMGLKKSLEFLAGRSDMEAYFIYIKNDGTISDTATGNFYNLIH